MGAGIYTQKTPYHPGWWWMKILDVEEPVEIEDRGGNLYVKGKEGRLTPLMPVDGVVWSMFPIKKPYKFATTRVRIILGDHAMEVEIRDEELLEAQFPGEILERNLAQMMVKIFQERIVPNRAAFQALQKDHEDLKQFIAERRPDYLAEFNMTRKASS